MTQALVIKVPGTASNPNLPYYKDIVAVNGVEFLFDLASLLSWPSLGTPANGDAVKDIAGGPDGAVAISAGQSIAYAGGGFDFSANTADGQLVTAPAGSLQSIHDAANDYFMVAFYAKFPVAGDWNVETTMSPFFCCTTGSAGYTGESDLVTIAQGSGGNLTSRRQTNGGSASSNINVSAAAHYGLLTQVAYWRNAAGATLHLKSSAGVTVGTDVVGADNTGDFSTKVPRWGITESFNTPSLPGHLNAWNWRLFRGWIEDLTVSGRDPATVLDADYARTIARGVFS